MSNKWDELRKSCELAMSTRGYSLRMPGFVAVNPRDIIALLEENEKLRAENAALRDEIPNPLFRRRVLGDAP